MIRHERTRSTVATIAFLLATVAAPSAFSHHGSLLFSEAFAHNSSHSGIGASAGHHNGIGALAGHHNGTLSKQQRAAAEAAQDARQLKSIGIRILKVELDLLKSPSALQRALLNQKLKALLNEQKHV